MIDLETRAERLERAWREVEGKGRWTVRRRFALVLFVIFMAVVLVQGIAAILFDFR